MIPRLRPYKGPGIKPVEFLDFSGGENTRDDATSIADNQNVSMQNTRITLQKAAQKRLGTVAYGTTLVSDSTSTVTGLFEHDDSNGVRLPVRSIWNGSSGKFQKLVSGTWTDVTGGTFSTGDEPFFVTFRARTGSSLKSATATGGTNLTLITSGLTNLANVGQAISIVGGTGSGQKRLILTNDTTTITVSERWDTNPDATSQYEIYAMTNVCYVTNGTDVPFFYNNLTGAITRLSGFPAYKGFVVYKNKLFGWLNDVFYWSTYGVGEDFPKLNYQEIYTSHGDSLTVLVPTDAWMMVFKERSTQKLVGNDVEDFELVPVDEEFGCIAPHSAKEYNSSVYFLSARGIEATTGIKIMGAVQNASSILSSLPVSDIIRPSVNGWTESMRKKAHAEVFYNRYYITVGSNSLSTTKDGVWIYDLIFNAWTHDTGYTANVMRTMYDTNSVPKLYIGDATATGKCYQLESGYSDNGNDITFKILTKKKRFSAMAITNQFEKFLYLFPSTTNGSEVVLVETAVDDNGFTIVDSFDLGANLLRLPFNLPAILGGSLLNNYRRFINKQGGFLQHRFTNTGGVDQVIILGYSGLVRDLSII